MKIKHTPGPWLILNPSGGFEWEHSAIFKEGDVVGYSENYKHPLRSRNKTIARVQKVGCKGENEANAQLIAAAPEMLDALRHVYARLEIEESKNPGGTYLCAAMRENIANVIKKATGKDIE